MAVTPQLVRQYDGSGRAQLVAQYSEAVALTLGGFIDAGNVDSTNTTITDATSTEPVVNLSARANAGDWRHLLFEVIGGEGKRPLFKAPRSTRYTNNDPTSEYLPVWTSDFVTWNYATSRSLVGGISGTIEWQFDSAFPAGNVYVATQPLGRDADAGFLTARLLEDYPSVVSPTDSADEYGVFHTSPTETQDARETGLRDMYALQLRFGGSTNDGGPKRKLVVVAGIHAAGEATSWLPFVYFVDYVISSDDSEAVAIRANWDINLYYNLTPNGVFSGDNRTNPTRGSDPNRIWDTPNNEILAAQTAIIDDLGGGRFDCFFSWHAWSSTDKPFLMYVTPDDLSLGTRSDLAQAFIDEGTTIFGDTPSVTSSGTNNTDVWWAKDNGAKAAFDTEVAQNGSTAQSFYQSIGENWAKTLQAVDAEGLFTTTTITASGAVQGQAGVSMSAEVVSAAIITAAAAHAASLQGQAQAQGAISSNAQAVGTIAARADFVATITAGGEHSSTALGQASAQGAISAPASHSQAMVGTVDAVGQIDAGMVVSATVSATASAQAQAVASMLASVQGGTAMTVGTVIDAAMSIASAASVGMTATIQANVDMAVAGSAGVVQAATAQASADIQVSAQAAVSLLAQAAAQAGITVSHVHNVTITGTTISGDLVTPDNRTFRVRLELRTFTVPAEDRAFNTLAEYRTFTVH